MFKICFRCPKCDMEMDLAVIPHFKSFAIAKLTPCYEPPEMVMIATLDDPERGLSKRGYVPEKDYQDGNDWAVDGTWENPPPGTMQVAVVPLPKDAHR